MTTTLGFPSRLRRRVRGHGRPLSPVAPRDYPLVIGVFTGEFGRGYKGVCAVPFQTFSSCQLSPTFRGTVSPEPLDPLPHHRTRPLGHDKFSRERTGGNSPPPPASGSHGILPIISGPPQGTRTAGTRTGGPPSGSPGSGRPPSQVPPLFPRRTPNASVSRGFTRGGVGREGRGPLPVCPICLSFGVPSLVASERWGSRFQWSKSQRCHLCASRRAILVKRAQFNERCDRVWPSGGWK